MSTFNSFPIPTVNSTIAVTATSQRVLLNGIGGVVLVKNIGSGECFIAAGDVTVTATAGAGTTDATDGSLSIAPGEIGTYSIPTSATYLAAVCATGITTTLRVARGDGA